MGSYYCVSMTIAVYRFIRQRLYPCTNLFQHPLVSDRDYNDGVDRGTFEAAVSHVATERFWMPESISELLLFEYTNWTHRDEEVANRQNYKEVRGRGQEEREEEEEEEEETEEEEEEEEEEGGVERNCCCLSTPTGRVGTRRSQTGRTIRR
jgi:hypothetical protein